MTVLPLSHQRIRTTDQEGLPPPLPPTCWPGWQRGKRTCMLVKEKAGWEMVELRVK
ncbi:thymosin, beta 4, isoform CRA_b [Rattus norvegicus]|uniref:Thymosin, beta 4, isoform CRA_b n=1 Tax=Rattus norvegicus TaxID=10116 RepID=A6K2G4_RAT|nr:thymosin, beta 4, isoform CRA_b [Rattus norvegicus]EDL90567.1 thymosin, beta 4, isoform CRA_b [Rattus norvegicus]